MILSAAVNSNSVVEIISIFSWERHFYSMSVVKTVTTLCVYIMIKMVLAKYVLNDSVCGIFLLIFLRKSLPQKLSPSLCITNFLFKDVCCALGFGHFRTNEVVKECQNLIITKSHTLLKGLDVKTRIWEGVICTKLSIFNHTYISSTRWITNIRLTLYKTYHYMSKDIFRTPLQKQMPLVQNSLHYEQNWCQKRLNSDQPMS